MIIWICAGIIWVLGIYLIAKFMPGGCSGDCFQGRRKCNCGKYDD
jgi:hypothetical protein